MATKPKNRFSRLKQKVKLLPLDISFLRTCKKEKLVPSFIQVKTSVLNARSEKVIKFAQSKWLDLEIKHKYKLLSDSELELMNIHLSLTKDLNSFEINEWYAFESQVNRATMRMKQKKLLSLNRKLNFLRERQSSPFSALKPEFIADFVVNKSSENFTEEELNLLNKGLKYSPKPEKVPIVEAIVDIETMLKYKVPSVQNDIRKTAANAINAAKSSIRTNTEAHNESKIIKNLREKKMCVYKSGQRE